MRRFIPMIGLLALAAQGCIIYEDDCDGCGFDDDWDDRWEDGWCDEDGSDDPDCGGDGGTDTDTPGDEPDVPVFSLSLSPNHAEVGETFIANLSAEGEFALEDIAQVEFLGGVEVLYSELRQDGLMLVVDVRPGAALGPTDLVVRRVDQPAVFVEGALLVFEAGSGNSANDCE